MSFLTGSEKHDDDWQSQNPETDSDRTTYHRAFSHFLTIARPVDRASGEPAPCRLRVHICRQFNEFPYWKSRTCFGLIRVHYCDKSAANPFVGPPHIRRNCPYIRHIHHDTTLEIRRLWLTQRGGDSLCAAPPPLTAARPRGSTSTPNDEKHSRLRTPADFNHRLLRSQVSVKKLSTTDGRMGNRPCSTPRWRQVPLSRFSHRPARVPHANRDSEAPPQR